MLANHVYAQLLLLLQPSVLWLSIVTFNNYVKPPSVKVNFARIWCITNPTPTSLGYLTLKRWHGKIWPQLRGLPDVADRATHLEGWPHLSCKRDQIKMRDYMDRRVTPPKRVTGRDPFNQNSNRSHREKRTTSTGGPVFSKLFRLDRTDPLSFGQKFPESLVEWIAPTVPTWGAPPPCKQALKVSPAPFLQFQQLNYSPFIIWVNLVRPESNCYDLIICYYFWTWVLQCQM